MGNTVVAGCPGANSGAVRSVTQTDHDLVGDDDLAMVIQFWPKLSSATKSAVLDMVRANQKKMGGH